MSIQLKETNSTPRCAKRRKRRRIESQSVILRATKSHVMKAFTEKKEQFDAWLKNQSDPVRSARTRRWTVDADDEDEWMDDRTT